MWPHWTIFGFFVVIYGKTPSFEFLPQDFDGTSFGFPIPDHPPDIRPTTAIFWLYRAPPTPKSFNFTSQDSSKHLQHIYLCSNVASDEPCDGDSHAIGSWSNGSIPEVNSRRSISNALPLKLNVTSDVNNPSKSIVIPNFLSLINHTTGKQLYFRLVDNENASYYSRSFTVTQQSFPDFGSSDDLKNIYNDPNPYSPDNPLPSASPGSAANNSSSHGLTTAAIVGIVIGSIVAAALVFIISTCLFLRHRNSGTTAIGYQREDNRSQKLIAEKTTSNGAPVSNHSPYSDDGCHTTESRGSTLVALSPLGASSARSGPTFDSHQPLYNNENSHYMDPIQRIHQPPTIQDSTASSSPHSAQGSTQQAKAHLPTDGVQASRSETPSGIPSHYRHLIEEGMTPDQIHDLMEEERQLDAEIEAAERRG